MSAAKTLFRFTYNVTTDKDVKHVVGARLTLGYRETRVWLKEHGVLVSHDMLFRCTVAKYPEGRYFKPLKGPYGANFKALKFSLENMLQELSGDNELKISDIYLTVSKEDGTTGTKDFSV